MALFKGSKENEFMLMAQTNIVFTQGNLGIKMRRGNCQLQRAQEGPPSGASAAFTGNHVSCKTTSKHFCMTRKVVPV